MHYSLSLLRVVRMYHLPRSGRALVFKCYAAIAICLCGRGGELHDMTWADITRVTDNGTENVSYHVRYDRCKQTSMAQEEREMSILR
jgi:hypothetical protein